MSVNSFPQTYYVPEQVENTNTVSRTNIKCIINSDLVVLGQNIKIT